MRKLRFFAGAALSAAFVLAFGTTTVVALQGERGGERGGGEARGGRGPEAREGVSPGAQPRTFSAPGAPQRGQQPGTQQYGAQQPRAGAQQQFQAQPRVAERQVTPRPDQPRPRTDQAGPSRTGDRGGDWARRGDWERRGDWDRRRDWDRRDRDWWWGGLGWGYPGWYGWGRPGWGWYGGWGRPGWGGYGYDYYPGSTYGSYGYAPGYVQPGTYGAAAPPAGQQQVDPARQSYDSAVSQFHQGNYQEASRLARQAQTQSPQNPMPQELLSLIFFAQGDYRQAAEHARQALTMAPPADWSTLFGYYNNLPSYTRHLDALANFVRQNPSSADGHFLLGYHDAMMGHNNEALQHFSRVAQLNPQDQLTSRLVQHLQGAPATAATPSATY